MKPTQQRFNPLFLLLLLFLALPVAGALVSFVQVFRDGVGVDGLRGPVAVAVSPDGAHVYVVGQDDDALAVFRRDSALGTLSFTDIQQDGVDGVFGLLVASDVAVSPDGRHVYVTAEVDDTLAVFRRDATTDTLSFVAAQVQEDLVGSVFGLDGASSVTVSPDDLQVFVTARVDDAIAVFRRDATQDDLTFVEAELDGVAGVDGLDGASSSVVSPDGAHVYVAAEIDDSVSVFARQLPAGTITFASKVTDQLGGVEGLDGASDVAIDPLGLHLYVASTAENAVALFDRDGATGGLTFQAVYRDGEDGNEGLAGANSVVLNASGDRVLVAGRFDNGIAVFRRHAVTGELAFLEVLSDGVDGNDGLAGARDISVHEDDAYVAAHDENALAFFDMALCVGDELSGDSDNDAFCDDVDLCLGDDLVGDGDADGNCDDLDICQGFDDALDGDGDTIPDGCDICSGDDATGDNDGDGVCDDLDVCAGSSDGFDSDGDGVPDGCDVCLGDDATGDSDADEVCDDVDACPGFDDEFDDDGDGVPDDCDVCFGDDATGDTDADLICDEVDACPGFDDAIDGDGDGVADGCDICLGDDATGDTDADLICDEDDACPEFDDNLDADGDGVPDGCDLCLGDDATGNIDGDGFCADRDCDDNDGGNACAIFADGFELGNTSSWSLSS